MTQGPTSASILPGARYCSACGGYHQPGTRCSAAVPAAVPAALPLCPLCGRHHAYAQTCLGTPTQPSPTLGDLLDVKVPVGWQCPVCRLVHAPQTLVCRCAQPQVAK